MQFIYFYFFKLETSCSEISTNIGILFSENLVALNVSREVGFCHLVFQEYEFICLWYMLSKDSVHIMGLGFFCWFGGFLRTIACFACVLTVEQLELSECVFTTKIHVLCKNIFRQYSQIAGLSH